MGWSGWVVGWSKGIDWSIGGGGGGGDGDGGGGGGVIEQSKGIEWSSSQSKGID